MPDERPPLYLIAVDDGSDESYATSRKVGLDKAREDGARVVLYDRSSESSLVDPYPAGNIDPRSDTVSKSSSLDEQSLEALGRGYLAELLTEARDMGLEADAYLGEGTGADAIADAVDLRRPDLVVLPSSVADSSLLDRLRGNTAAKMSEQVPARILFVDGDGREVTG